MRSTLKRAAFAAGVAAAVLFSGRTAEAGCLDGSGGSYFHAPGGGTALYGYGGWRSRYSLYRPSHEVVPGYGYGVGPYAPAVPGFGAMPYGGYSFGTPRGELTYDVYTPFGRQEVEYEFRRNGRIDVDLDD
ncbi:MAG TPA: hypothetical protein VF170_17395 [Planctomycetaceae bacterium]